MLKAGILKKVASSVNVFLVILLSLSAQADDVSLTNPPKSKKPVQFRVVIRSTGFDRTITVQPGQTVNAIGTDLWHNAYVEITGLGPDPHGKDDCYLAIDEKSIDTKIFFKTFYLPEVIKKAHVRACPYTSNVPDCGCFLSDKYRSGDCYNDCTDVSNAEVVVGY